MKIPLRSYPLEKGFNETLIDFMSEDYEFVFMLWGAGTFIPLVSLLLKCIFPG